MANKLRLTTSESDFLEFKTKYESLSGLEIPFSYFDNSKVYLYECNQKIVGGFILSSKLPLRTVDLFTSDEYKSELTKTLGKGNICEVCCLWMERKVRKNRYQSAKFWIQAAFKISKQQQEIIVFGTNCKGLTKMYNYPKASILFHEDKVSNKPTYIYLARRKDFIRGSIELVVAKIIKRTFKRNSFNNVDKSLLNKITYAVSN